MKEEKGITLIVVIITIIVLLILAGVSIATLTGNNGILDRTLQAKSDTELANEEEVLKLTMVEQKLEEKDEIGIKLYDKTLQNGNCWHTIVFKDSNKVYGTGWTYVPINTEIDNYGSTQFSWVLNVETGKLIQLAENSYTELSYETNLGATEGLVFNLDPSIISDMNKEDLKNNYKSVLGENVELKNIDWNEDSGLTKTSFNFDGIDDQINVKYDNQEEKDKMAKNGFTFEFYGSIDGGTSYNDKNQIIEEAYKGLFCYWNGKENNQAKLRFGIQQKNSMKWNAGWNSYVSTYSEASYPWNIMYPKLEKINDGQESYITVTVDCNNSYEVEGQEYYKQTVYFNGEKVYEGDYNKKSWENFIKNDLKGLSYFSIGRSSMTGDGWWHYSKMKTYALRLYNRALTQEEVNHNYDKSVAYHEGIAK